MSTAVQVRSSFLTDVGRVRERNEDACFAGDHVFAVADGLGGHRAGEVASDLALGSVRALDQAEARAAAKGVAEAVRKGNRAVHDRAETDDSLRGMGTTMTAVVISGNTAFVAHVGDSRCYLIRGGAITQLSRDHTLVARMVSEGRLTPEQAEAHPQRSVLTRALGADKEVDVDESRFSLIDGDRLLLCSDGLTGMLGDDEIRDFATGGSDLDEICRRLIDAANDGRPHRHQRSGAPRPQAASRAPRFGEAPVPVAPRDLALDPRRTDRRRLRRREGVGQPLVLRRTGRRPRCHLSGAADLVCRSALVACARADADQGGGCRRVLPPTLG
ncbi:MAG: Stp1/IreP family PP2C-type Ser/Thr phosphatase [Actinobacteria bacterium]|nr:MAG: Stp1/IreP family PP2C-type Ser/Thr phosphatase [Actinomycetota bacterium]